MNVWPDQIANEIVQQHGIMDAKLQATITYFTLLGWIVAYLACAAVAAGTCYLVFLAVRAAFRWVCAGVDSVLEEDIRQ
jgi:ABC-type multidrug transport system permease subunit